MSFKLIPGKLYQILSEYKLRYMMRSSEILKHHIKGFSSGMNPFHHTHNQLFSTNDVIMFLDYKRKTDPSYDNYFIDVDDDDDDDDCRDSYDHPGIYSFLIKQHTVSFSVNSTYSVALRSILNPID